MPEGRYNLYFVKDSANNLYAAYLSSSNVDVFKYEEESWGAKGSFSTDDQDIEFTVYNNTPYVLNINGGNLSVKKYNGTSWDELATTTEGIYLAGDIEEIISISTSYSIRDLSLTDNIYFSTGRDSYHYDLAADDYSKLGQFGGNSNYGKVAIDSNGDLYGASAFDYRLEVYKFNN